MTNFIPGYSYDIFISYRQKDNKHDGWVTEFVENLKAELESAFKEEISVYFDVNPHDGLLETHDVDASLKEKLRCLIFIPVISRTYCDTRSFAWEHEFKAFIEQASEDPIGLKVKLTNGNVANRVLPIRIHDLDPEDVRQCEALTGGFLRGIEFIYREAGVSRPLTRDDDAALNLNKTKYINQVNKVANAIREIISGIKASVNDHKPPDEQLEKSSNVAQINRDNENQRRLGNKKLIITSAIAFSIILAGIFLLNSKSFLKDKNESDGKISIAVNTFDNLTGDKSFDIWCTGISELLIGNLGLSNEIAVQNSQTMNEVYESLGKTNTASVIPSIARQAAVKLKTKSYISGSILKTGNKIRLQLKLIDTKNDELLWTGKVDGDLNSDYIDLAETLSNQVKDFLEIKSLEQVKSRETKDAFTKNPDAYREYIEGMNLMMNSDYLRAIGKFKEAFRIDSTFTLAAFYIAYAYSAKNPGDSLSAEWTKIAFKGKDRLPDNYQLWVQMWNSFFFTKNTNEILSYLNSLENSDIQSRFYWFDIAITYASGEIFDKSLKPFQKIESLNSQWNDDWKFLNYYTEYGRACHKTGNHKKEARIFNTGLELFPDNPNLLFGQARCAIARGDSSMAGTAILKMKDIHKKSGGSEISYLIGLGQLYMQGGYPEKAEEYLRRAYVLDSTRLGVLCDCLVFYDRNIDEGIKLAKKGYELYPDNFGFLFVLGTGLYKKGYLSEADSVLNLAKESCSTWAYPINQQILAVRNAMANQKK